MISNLILKWMITYHIQCNIEENYYVRTNLVHANVISLLMDKMGNKNMKILLIVIALFDCSFVRC